MKAIRVTAAHRVCPAPALKTRGQQFGLLAWLLQNPDALSEPSLQRLLFFANVHFPDPKAAWLAREVLIRGCDLEVIEKDAMRERHHDWFRLFMASAKVSTFARPPEIALRK